MSERVDVGAVLFVLGLSCLAFMGGALLMASGTFPADQIDDAYRAAKALYARQFTYIDRYTTDLWMKAQTDQRGVTVFDESRAAPGWTLYTSGHAATALLVDLRGNLVHQWRRPYSELWDDSASVRRPVPDQQIYLRKADLLPNGDLLALYEGVGDTPYGYGIARLDPDSGVVWKNLDNLHHDFDVTADGRIIALSHAFRTTALRGADQFDPPYLEDSLVVIGADGTTRYRLSLMDAFNDSRYRALLWRIPYYSMEDPLHANAVDYLDAEKARRLAQRLPAARPGQVLVSLRELAGGSIALVDLDQRKVVWATHGPWLAQHDPDIMPDGTIQVFDNRGNMGGVRESRLIRVDPATMGIVWRYAGDAEHPLDSPIRGSQQTLPNGNTLITESSGGRLLEITEGGETVWEYYNPVRGGENDDDDPDGSPSQSFIPVVSWARRVAESELEPAFARKLHEAASAPVAD